MAQFSAGDHGLLLEAQYLDCLPPICWRARTGLQPLFAALAWVSGRLMRSWVQQESLSLPPAFSLPPPEKAARCCSSSRSFQHPSPMPKREPLQHLPHR